MQIIQKKFSNLYICTRFVICIGARRRMKIKEKDTILVISGKDRGKTGKVEKVFKNKNKLLVSGIAIVKKSSKPTKKNPKGGIISMSSPINISNTALICPKCNKKTRVKYKKISQKKVRVCGKCREQI